MWPRGLPHPQRWLDKIFGALRGGSGGRGGGPGNNRSILAGKSSILCEELEHYRVHGLGADWRDKFF